MVLVTGTLIAADRPVAAVLMAAATVLIGVALGFGRVTLRITTVVVLALVVVLAVRTPPPEERDRVQSRESSRAALETDTLQQLTNDLQAKQAALDATTDPSKYGAAQLARDQAQVAVDEQRDLLNQTPTAATGPDQPWRAVNAWVAHAWHKLTNGPQEPSPNLEPWEWALLAGAAIFLYRYLEVLSSKRDPGPVTITAVRDRATRHRPMRSPRHRSHHVEDRDHPASRAGPAGPVPARLHRAPQRRRGARRRRDPRSSSGCRPRPPATTSSTRC